MSKRKTKNTQPIIIKKMEGFYINMGSMTETLKMVNKFNTLITEADYINIFGETLGQHLWFECEGDFIKTCFANIQELHRKRLLDFTVGKYYRNK